MSKLLDYLRNPGMFVLYFGRRGFFKWMSDKRYLGILFKTHFDYKINWENPKTYNEKMQWIKLYDRNPLYPKLVDKYEVREYVTNVIGSKYLVPLIWMGNDIDDIDYNVLPERFVIKCTHDSQSVRICKNKSEFDFNKCRSFINSHLKENLYWAFREWAYKSLPPRIIVEEFIGDTDKLPEDYKFYVFDGVIDSIMVCKDRDLGYPKFYFYDTNWSRLRYLKNEPQDDIDRPQNLEEMISVVERLSKDLNAVRVDLYNVAGQIYFGELTFYNQGGFDLDITYDTDLHWGSRFKLSNIAKNEVVK